MIYDTHWLIRASSNKRPEVGTRILATQIGIGSLPPRGNEVPLTKATLMVWLKLSKDNKAVINVSKEMNQHNLKRKGP